MITLTEKRLQELENKISLFSSIIEDQKKAISESEQSNKLIRDLKYLFESLKINVNTFKDDCHVLTMSSINKIEGMSFDLNILKQDSNKYNDSILRLESSCLDFSKNISVVKNDVLLLSDSLTKYIPETSTLIVKNKKSEDEILDIRKAVLVITDSLKAFKSDLSGVCEREASNQYVCKDSIDELKRSVSINDSNFIGLKDSLEDFTSRINSSIKSIEQDNIKFKSLLDVILSLQKEVSPKAADDIERNSFSDEKQNSKIRTIEHSIAQIYELLKRYDVKGV